MITRSRGRDLQTRAFALTDMVRWGYSGLRNIKPSVGEKQAKGIPALHRAAKLRAEAVAGLKLYCWKGDGPTRERLDTVWQARLFRNGPQPTATNPVQTRFSFWETVEESLAWRGNGYIWKNIDPSSGRIVEWWALHPDQVTPQYDGNGNIQYRIEVAPGYVDPVGRGKAVYVVDDGTILHIRGYGEGGQLTAPSPIEVFKRALEGPVGRQQHEARMWRRGTALQQAVMLPANVGKEQAEQWREVWRANYEGADGETTVVLGGGMDIKPIGMTMQDAQFVEMYDLTAKDASSIMGVPANLLGVQVTNVRSNLEDDLMAWLRFGLAPELARIEEALYADTDLFGGSQTEPGFDTTDFVRGDLATEATILIGLVQAGLMTPNEGRHKLGYERDDAPESDTLQATPVGGAENPGIGLPKLKPSAGETPGDDNSDGRSAVQPIELNVNVDASPIAREVDAMRRTLLENAQAAAAEKRAAEVAAEERRRDDRARELAELRERDERLASALEREQPAPVVNVDVQVPETAAPEVRVTVPEQPPAQIVVNVPEQAPPVVHVNVPEGKPGRKRAKVSRHPNGFIDELTIEDE